MYLYFIHSFIRSLLSSYLNSSAGADPGVEIGGPYGERGARAYNQGLTACEDRGEVPEAERFLCRMPKMALNCYIYELFCETNNETN